MSPNFSLLSLSLFLFLSFFLPHSLLKTLSNNLYLFNTLFHTLSLVRLSCFYLSTLFRFFPSFLLYSPFFSIFPFFFLFLLLSLFSLKNLFFPLWSHFPSPSPSTRFTGWHRLRDGEKLDLT